MWDMYILREKIWSDSSNPYEDPNEIVIVATTPDTLEEYLSYVASREQRRNRIAWNRLFPLCELLINQPYQLEYSQTNDDQWVNMLFVANIDNTPERTSPLLPSDLRKGVRSTEEYVDDGIKYISLSSNKETKRAEEIFYGLFEIHKFFFPLNYEECK